MTRAVTGEQVLLPVWYNVTKQEIIAHSSSLAGKVGRSTGTHMVSEIAAEIVTVVKAK